MGLGQKYQRVGEYGQFAKIPERVFKEKFRYPFLVLIEVSNPDPEEDTDDFFTGTRTGVELNTLLEIVEGRRLDPAAPVFPVIKREGANPYSGLITIGRASNCDIVLHINGVSKFHAYLAESLTEPGQFLVGDGSSKNGTLLNGRRIDRKFRSPIYNGDSVSLSAVLVLRFFTPGGFWSILQF